MTHKPKLTVVTPCSRPQNLARMAKGVVEGLVDLDLQWAIAHDCRSGPCEPIQQMIRAPWNLIFHVGIIGSVAGHGQVNAILNRVTSGWIWRLDDDNLPVAHFFKFLRTHIQNPDADLILFSQLAKGRYDESRWPSGTAYPVPKVEWMDSAQMVFRREVLGPLRLKFDWYKADGQLAEDLYARVGKDRTIFDTRPLTLYNALT